MLIERTSPTCLWSRDGDEEHDVWGTSCGRYFTIIEGTPTDNEMRFCCYCGGNLEENNDADR